MKKLKTKPLLLQLPISNNEKYHGHIDLIEMNAIIYSDELGNTVNIVPIEQYNEKLNIEALKERENMLETLSEVDDEFAEKFLSGEFTV